MSRPTKSRRVDFEVDPAAASVECKFCPDRIVWVKSKRGKAMPLHTLTKVEDLVTVRMESHWPYCRGAVRARISQLRGGRPKKKRNVPTQCRAIGCEHKLGPLLVPFCRIHWGRVPPSIQRWLVTTWFNYHADKGTWAKFCEASHAAVTIIKKQETGDGDVLPAQAEG